MRFRRLCTAIGAVSLAAILAGCTATSAPTSSTAATAPRTSPAAATPTVTVTQEGSQSTPAASSGQSASTVRTDPAAPASQCPDKSLAVSVQNDPTGSGAGQRLSYVVFRNTGSSSCVLRGAAGVSLVGNGTQIGAAADRATTGPTVTIPAGSYALATLSYPAIDKNGGAYGDGDGHDPKCEAKAVDGYRVYPPHSYRAYFTHVADLYGCSTSLRTLSVSAVEPPSKYADFKPKA